MAEAGQWLIDTTGELLEAAKTLVKAYPQKLGHVHPDRILFIRLVGSKQSWLGKCYLVKPPHSCLGNGSYDFIIVINDDLVRGVFTSPLKERMVLLHELQHIGTDGKLVTHDIEDFVWMLRKFGLDYEAPMDQAQIKEVIEIFKTTDQQPGEDPPSVA